MPRVHHYQSSFNAGEISPRLLARTDFQKYTSALETMENIIPLAEGGAMRRPGTRYVAEVKNSANKARLRRFEFSTTQAYILEFGASYIRFYRNQAQITVPDITASIANGEFGSGITSWTDQSGAGGSISHDSTNNRMSLTSDGVDDAHAEQQVANSSAVEHVIKFRVYGAPGDSVKLRIGTTSTGTEIVNDFDAKVGFHAYSFTATAADFYVQFLHTTNKTLGIDNVSLIDDAPVEVETPYATADLFFLRGPQSADVLYILSGVHPVYKLERRGHTTWSLVEVAWQDGPYLAMNQVATTLNPSAATGLGITITASSTEGINGGEGFKDSDIGRSIRLDNKTGDGDFGWAVITARTSTTVVTADVKRDFSSTSAGARWHLGAFSGTTGYPAASTFFQERLYLANTTDQPTTLWASQTGDFENMSPDSPNSSDEWDGTVEDDDALNFTLSADNVNAILWLVSVSKALTVGTLGGEWVSSSQGAVLTPSDASFDRHTAHGSADIEPVAIDNLAVFIQRAQRKIRQFGFTFESDSFTAQDLTRLARHITFGGLTEMAYQEEPDSIIWVVRDDGVLLSVTFRSEEDVVGWSRHILGGSFSSGDAVVESVSVIPGANGAGQVHDSTSRDEVWVIVKRTINGATKRYIEVFERYYENGHDQEDAYYVDALGTYDGTETSTVSGLDYLEGQTVKVWADGAVHADKTVSSGQITLDTPANVVQVGLGYSHTLKTLKLEGGNPSGTSVAKKKRIYRMGYVVLNSHLLKVGPDTSNLSSLDFRVVADVMDSPADLFSGEKILEFEGDWILDPRVVIQDDTPAPFTLLALAFETDINPMV